MKFFVAKKIRVPFIKCQSSELDHIDLFIFIINRCDLKAQNYRAEGIETVGDSAFM